MGCSDLDRRANRIEKVEVGKYREWAKVSDHVPLIVEVALGQK
jgi:endonuclease/exonuclease/phosphatase family metal-dependent hydrolase